ncbi:MAG: DUF692 family protein [Myxococcales bacterium]|nr:DUF692 family protein [Myxococcales bacterium]
MIDAAAARPNSRQIKVGLTLMPSKDWLVAAKPLLIGNYVEALEWSWDVETTQPPWALGLIEYFAGQGALYGHGVMYSAFSAEFEPRQQAALEKTATLRQLASAVHITEHVGFSTIKGMLRGAPLPSPPCRASVQTARDQLGRIADAVGRPVGVENLALAISMDDVALQGDMIEEILVASDAPFVLDLHNLYCQAINFSIPAEQLLRALPLHRVREIHVSGGRMHAVAGGATKRRDTHDQLVPEDVWTMLRQCLPQCPRVEVVFLERLAGTLQGQADELFLDFQRMKREVDTFLTASSDLHAGREFGDEARVTRQPLPHPSEAHELAAYQQAFVGLLRKLPSVVTAHHASELRTALAAATPSFAGYAISINDDMLIIAHAAFSRWHKVF